MKNDGGNEKAAVYQLMTHDTIDTVASNDTIDTQIIDEVNGDTVDTITKNNTQSTETEGRGHDQTIDTNDTITSDNTTDTQNIYEIKYTADTGIHIV